MYKIALTGGIGTGKTYVSHFFIKMGTPIFYADDVAKEIYRESDVMEALHWHFGDNVFTGDKVDFYKVAQVVFPVPEYIEIVNNLIHPKVMQKFDEWVMQQSTPSVMMESALIYEGEFEKYFDAVIVVDAPLPLRIERIKKRSPLLSEEEIMRRISSQLPQEQKCSKADLVIKNY